MPRLSPLALLFACALTSSALADDVLERGHAILEENCGRCHATGPEGDSPLAAAPGFARSASAIR